MLDCINPSNTSMIMYQDLKPVSVKFSKLYSILLAGNLDLRDILRTWTKQGLLEVITIHKYTKIVKWAYTAPHVNYFITNLNKRENRILLIDHIRSLLRASTKLISFLSYDDSDERSQIQFYFDIIHSSNNLIKFFELFTLKINFPTQNLYQTRSKSENIRNHKYVKYYEAKLKGIRTKYSPKYFKQLDAEYLDSLVKYGILEIKESIVYNYYSLSLRGKNFIRLLVEYYQTLADLIQLLFYHDLQIINKTDQPKSKLRQQDKPKLKNKANELFHALYDFDVAGGNAFYFCQKHKTVFLFKDQYLSHIKIRHNGIFCIDIGLNKLSPFQILTHLIHNHADFDITPQSIN